MNPAERAIADKIVSNIYHHPEKAVHFDVLKLEFVSIDNFEAMVKTLMDKKIIEMPASTFITLNPLVSLTPKGILLGGKLEENDSYLNNYKVLTYIQSLGHANSDWNKKHPLIFHPFIRSEAQLLGLFIFYAIMVSLWVLHKIGLF